jgi:NAD(P)H-hydrate epimerase
MQRIASAPPLPSRPRSGHKGLFGRVLVVGGSDDMIGAPVLAGTAALRTGSGLVQVAMPRDVLAGGLSITPELIGLGLRGGVGRDLLAAARDADVIIVGPGMGQSPAAKARVMRLVRIDKPMVIDADALNILASQKRWPASFQAPAVLTPHPGEMKRLGNLLGVDHVPTDDEGRSGLAASAARKFDQILVLKGDRTVVTDGDRVYLNDTGNSALSKAGSGDILSGIIASLIGQGMDRFDAACAGVRLHGLAGEVAGERLGLRSPLARDVIDAIPQAIALYEKREL